MDSPLVSLPLELKVIIARMLDPLSLRMLVMTHKEIEKFLRKTPELRLVWYDRPPDGVYWHNTRIRLDYLRYGSLKQLKCCRFFQKPSCKKRRFATQCDARVVLNLHSIDESLKILKWFHSLGKMTGDNYLVDQVVSRYEDNRILNWLLSAGYKPKVSNMTAAACHGNLEAMQMLHKVGCKIDPKPVLVYTLRAKNAKDILQWLDNIHMENWRSIPRLFELLDFSLVKLAIQVGNLEVLDWLLGKELLNRYRNDYYQLHSMFRILFKIPRPSPEVCAWLSKNDFVFRFRD